ncbi:MAG: riboflavin synthase [Bacteroidia bacterium]|nr:riboflavin synthase [Bacteroidia bacterium]MBT8270152.1 riboflavin synthase [Bacteroidia bacterium]NNF82925.1 riboflavin synthase [Flavobacteriaceae bacterium]NNK68874.1 riboflavin synthase [Flavobacteriaceae bacterium]NNL80856.1 riboflavin synthase [Flavobacteriaceae bacterium]
MFTGIIESMGEITRLEQEGNNVHFGINCGFSEELKVDQSVAHNGVCLTVVAKNEHDYTVTAIDETLKRSNLAELVLGDKINLERGMRIGDRLDGHIVQGHVDQTAKCTAVEEMNGSWIYRFVYNPEVGNVTIPKGSITVNGVSLTVVDSDHGEFSVAIIPYTFDNTNFHSIKVGTKVNLEFDVIGKYVARLNEAHK